MRQLSSAVVIKCSITCFVQYCYVQSYIVGKRALILSIIMYCLPWV